MSNKILIKILLSFMMVCIISCSINGNTKSLNNLSKAENEIQSLSSKSIIQKDINHVKEIKKPHHHSKHKSHKKMQRLKQKSENEKLKTEIDSKEIKDTNTPNTSPQSDSFLYVSWFIFVPLVLLIFIMTILSIAGFLILILNSTGTHSHNHNPITQDAPRARIATPGNLSNTEILEILRYKHQMKKKSKANKNTSYKPEPEPEGVVFRS
jgi:ATP-dependent Zn protease